MSQSRRERKVMPLRNKKALGVLLGLMCLSLLGCNQKQITIVQTEVSKNQMVTNEKTTSEKESTEEITKEETPEGEVTENDVKENSPQEISSEEIISKKESFEKEKTSEESEETQGNLLVKEEDKFDISNSLDEGSNKNGEEAEAKLVVTLSAKDKKKVTKDKNSTTNEKSLSKEQSTVKQEKNANQKQTQDKGSEHKIKQDKVEQSISLSISCGTILAHKDNFDQEKIELLPSDGVILEAEDIEFEEGDTVFDVLVKATKTHKIHMEYTGSKEYKTNYIEGIHNIYEFDCGPLSGWMYRVNGSFPNYGCSNYTLKAGDIVEWVYTCDLGKDVGAESITQSGDAQ